MRYPFTYFRTGIYALVVALSSNAAASAPVEPTYFIMDGNPAAVRYALGRLERLPTQDADDVEGLKTLEAVSALQRSPSLSSFSTSKKPTLVQISPPRLPEYSVAMFEIFNNGSVMERARPANLVWSGESLFHEVLLDLPGVDARLKRSLVSESRRLLVPMLDFRAYEPVGRRLKIDGPVSIRDYGRTTAAPHLAFVDVTWKIKNLPDALANRGIDSLSPFLRVEYVVDTRTGRRIYRNTTNDGSVGDRDMRLFKEPSGSLLMAVPIVCSDGAEPLILDLEHESYGTGRSSDVPDVQHCFPAQ